jgi:hypothetical protein
MHAICDARHKVKFAPVANADVVDVMKRCLDRDPRTRITMPVRIAGLCWFGGGRC